MLTNKKIKTDNSNKIFSNTNDNEILRSLIDYLLISKNNKTNNNNNANQYKIKKILINRNEIFNYILVSKKWYNFISLTISNNIIDNKSFEHWLEINYTKKSYTKNNNNQIQYDKKKINFNKKFSIIKIQESIINDYFKFNLFLDNFTINYFKEIKDKYENNQLDYKRIVVNLKTNSGGNKKILLNINEYVSNENSEIIPNLFKILELNSDFKLDKCYIPISEGTEIYLNNLSISGYEGITSKIFQIFKSKKIIYDGSCCPTNVNYSKIFDPDNSGQQVESIKVKNESGNKQFVEPHHLIKVYQFENLHSITIPMDSFQILSGFSEKMGFNKFDMNNKYPGNSKNMESELNQMINSFITSESLKNLKISSVCSQYVIFKMNIDKINQIKESISKSFKPLFSELNTSIERIELDCGGILNINTFSNLLNNKSIKYLYLYDSDFIVYSFKQTGGGSYCSINQFLFENIFSSPQTSIKHYGFCFKKSNELELIFNLILNNIFKLQLYSLIFVLNKNELIEKFVKEYGKFIKKISTLIQKPQQEQQEKQEQEQQPQEIQNLNLKEIKIKIKIKIKLF
ncbi:hypothetical protein DDB_G0271424 [Dictyostelium discoideum AX4]|uniref:Uncharacterized protein n=1 Tax=Dictyostelium discoideum TaxID=44689 RepID=Q55B65_DICDI|nr:hypothetical protein DDB_G0271424 [Dictyostelium discoideum AX4]EAL71842.1 hypothetical protein DDB_G0271424 [Dictyostelium discoideum AX4]|eukprot:XP_645747.1 hypothetical protein DDB_G0271424 [Dictyostelium discoideum AX4]